MLNIVVVESFELSETFLDTAAFEPSSVFIMSALNKRFVVNKVESVPEMKTLENPLVKTAGAALSCGRCTMLYTNYKHLLEHLYWRHGTESFWCNMCRLKRWRYAPHVCHVLPINDADIVEDSDSLYYKCSKRESDYCFCGKNVEGSSMIGCDGPQCAFQWYHFKCVGIVSAPVGDWLCPECIKQAKPMAKKKAVGVKT